jgi:head-tail adaptor
MIPAALLAEKFVAEARPTAERDDHGGLTAGQEWTTVRSFYGSYEAQAYVETETRAKVGGTVQALIRCRYFPDIVGGMRLRWSSRSDRLLYVSSVVERANRTELEITVEEQVA